MNPIHRTHHEFTHAHLFCGLGGGAKGFNLAKVSVGSATASFRCIGGIDVDAPAVRDFDRLSGVRGTVMDLFDREQYVAFHGHEPPAAWREATPADIKRAFGNESPTVCVLSAPCKGFSGLLSEEKSKTQKYVALNRLTLRGMWLCLEAWKDDLPSLWVFENVPRLKVRGKHLLDQIVSMLQSYGYATCESEHDCGELGGLAQSRKRFLLVARHTEKVPPMLYQPESKPLKGVGEVLGRMPLPGDLRAGPMHRIPNLSFKTWTRLALIEAGSDWRSLNRLRVEDGYLADYLIVPALVSAAQCIDPKAAQGLRVPDGRAPAGAAQYQQYGVRHWDQPSGTIIGIKSPGQGSFSVADNRFAGVRHNNVFKVVRWDRHSGTVTGGGHPSSGGLSVADPRPQGQIFGKYAVTPWDSHAGTVISGSTTGQGAFAVADLRTGMDVNREAYRTGGHYGVLPWDAASGAVSAAACHDNGRWSVSDPRLPAPTDKLVAVIEAEDGTWHRPLTTAEMAALQSLMDPEEQLVLDGLNDQEWRERIGNAIPPRAMQAVAEEMGRTLLLAKLGETFQLSATPIWVRKLATAISLAQADTGATKPYEGPKA